MAYWLGEYFEKEPTEVEKIQLLLKDNKPCPRLKAGLEYYCEVTEWFVSSNSALNKCAFAYKGCPYLNSKLKLPKQ